MGEKHQAGQPLASSEAASGSASKWEEQHVKELSTLLLRFTRRCGRLPSPSDHTFWQLCCDCLYARFTPAQLLYKMHYLKRRFVHLTSGHANSIRPNERETFGIWAQIMQQVPPKRSYRRAAARLISPAGRVDANSRGGKAHGQQATTHKTAAASRARHTGTSDRYSPRTGTQLPHDDQGGAPYTFDKHAKKTAGEPAYCKGKFNGVADEFNHAKGVPFVAKSAARNEEEQPEISTYSDGVEPPLMSEHEEDESFTRHDAGSEGIAQDGGGVRSARHESAHDMAMLHHITVADLAAATRVLAEVLHSHNPYKQ
ncbi:hypothetical protein GOP47_0016842 [Adiantum capillus-veneris]|uniref:Uncharacterized protein n=1 Tax=Adiantum capillus-veneris TaxID=13818 RepID=A0A9D4ZC33_ADICA|nr:hypothetical protein GOP47_0016842 [Adiantum capillus-veneris]